jgi:hypothetical protein
MTGKLAFGARHRHDLDLNDPQSRVELARQRLRLRAVGLYFLGGKMVERNRLIELAPKYYQLAFCAFFSKGNNKIASSMTLWQQAGSDHNATFWHALNGLVEKGILEVIRDDFGPPLYRKTDAFEAQWKEIKNKSQPDTPAFKYNLDPNGEVWLTTAMQAVNKALKEQDIKPEEFGKPDAEWEPLPVERTNAKLKKATEELEKTIEAAEADNGYAANLPEEKAFVVENLKNAVEKLKTENSISYAYLKRKAIDALDTLIRRFGKASLGLVAQSARAALFDWLKEIGGKALHWLI